MPHVFVGIIEVVHCAGLFVVVVEVCIVKGIRYNDVDFYLKVDQRGRSRPRNHGDRISPYGENRTAPRSTKKNERIVILIPGMFYMLPV